MPLPQPKPGESRDEFVSRCVAELTDSGEFDSDAQRVAVCNDIYDRRSANLDALSIVGERTPQTTGGYGIRKASDYVRPMLDCMGDAACCDLAKLNEFKSIDRAALLKHAEETLTYSNEDTAKFGDCLTSACDIDEFCKQIKVERPPRTLMVVENVVTTAKEDRDGDILRTDGAIIDQNMPALWHHMLPVISGKMLAVLSHTSTKLKVATAIADTAIGNDTAVLVEFGALRISHGFRPIKFKRRKRKETRQDGDNGEETMEMPGLDFIKFEIMEESFVSVPSNTDAIITAHSRGKLVHPVVTRWSQQVFDNRKLILPVSFNSWDTTNIPDIPRDEANSGEREVDDAITKQGRTLSRKNQSLLENASEHVGDIISNSDATRTIKSLAKQAKNDIDSVLESVRRDEEEEKQAIVEDRALSFDEVMRLAGHWIVCGGKECDEQLRAVADSIRNRTEAQERAKLSERKRRVLTRLTR